MCIARRNISYSVSVSKLHLYSTNGIIVCKPKNEIFLSSEYLNNIS